MNGCRRRSIPAHRSGVESKYTILSGLTAQAKNGDVRYCGDLNPLRTHSSMAEQRWPPSKQREQDVRSNRTESIL